MRKESHSDHTQARNDSEAAVETQLSARGTLPNRLMTAFEVAEFVGCHEESVRRAYLCGQLKRQRFGVRSCRFDPADVQDWIARGAPTRISERGTPANAADGPPPWFGRRRGTWLFERSAGLRAAAAVRGASIRGGST